MSGGDHVLVIRQSGSAPDLWKKNKRFTLQQPVNVGRNYEHCRQVDTMIIFICADSPILYLFCVNPNGAVVHGSVLWYSVGESNYLS